MPIVNIQTNLSLSAHQQEQLLTQTAQATSQALNTDLTRIDVALQQLAAEHTIVGGVAQRPFVRYTIQLLTGRSIEAKQTLVKQYYEVAQSIAQQANLDVKTIIHDLSPSDLALRDSLVG